MVKRDYVFALSRFGMPYDQFLDLTPVEFYDACSELSQHEEDLALAHVRMICESIRLQTFHLVNVQLPRGKKINNLKKIMVFKWEKDIEPAQTMEQMKGIMKAIAKGWNKNKKKDDKRRGSLNR